MWYGVGKNKRDLFLRSGIFPGGKKRYPAKIAGRAVGATIGVLAADSEDEGSGFLRSWQGT